MNILVLTSKYPSDDTVYGFTPVVHYFAKEWVKQGNKVKVIHIQNKYPFLFYFIPNFVRKIFESKFGFAFPVLKMSTERIYTLENVFVHRFLIFRLSPFGGYFKSFVEKLYQKIVKSNTIDDFVPDIIISHWTFPQILIMNMLSQRHNCKSAISFHDVPILDKKSKNKFLSELEKVSYIGFRSPRIYNEFISKFHMNRKFYYCFSGVNEKYIINESSKDIQYSVTKFLYVGTLVKRKNVDYVIKALANLSKEQECSLDIVGEGPEKQSLINLTINYNLKASFLGHLSHAQVLNQMSLAECFIMVSVNEVFGLVYLEAMAKGCIVVASKGEGMDGIIEHGINGFLCQPGNEAELVYILRKITLLSLIEKKQIIENSISTAAKYTESKVAEKYLHELKDK